MSEMTAIVRRGRWMAAAETAAEIILTALGSLRGTDPALVERFVLTETPGGDAWLFAVIDDLRIESYEPWVRAVHGLSTNLRGKPVYISNSSGFRYAVLLSERPPLPERVDFPGTERGVVRLGVRRNGRPLAMAWRDLGHVLVAGQTQYGKSNFLRLLVAQARMEGYRLLLGDLDGRTFSGLRGDAALALPVASTREGFERLMEAALAELGKRSRMFDGAATAVDNLAEYNAQASEPLAPMLVVLDEFSSVVQGLGGPRSAWARDVTELAWRGLKFGLQVVLAGQDFSKEIVGAVREQMRTRLAFRVATADVSDIVIGRRGAERLRVPGRAMTPETTVQTYFVDKSLLTGEQAAGPQVSEAERALMERLMREAEGRVDMTLMMSWGMSEREVRRLREDWQRRGLAERRADRNNAVFLVPASWTSERVQAASERPDEASERPDGRDS